MAVTKHFVLQEIIKLINIFTWCLYSFECGNRKIFLPCLQEQKKGTWLYLFFCSFCFCTKLSFATVMNFSWIKRKGVISQVEWENKGSETLKSFISQKIALQSRFLGVETQRIAGKRCILDDLLKWEKRLKMAAFLCFGRDFRGEG